MLLVHPATEELRLLGDGLHGKYKWGGAAVDAAGAQLHAYEGLLEQTEPDFGTEVRAFWLLENPKKKYSSNNR
mgnify:CR=1 FL=1